MSSGTVNVLISTYNGEKYISEQIDSILRQKYRDIRIIVRDDGSSDRTVEILKKYQDQGRIILIEGENIGYGRSFYQLVKYAEEGEYWAFCDQDDIWHPKKESWAVEWLEKQPFGIPALFGSAYVLTDERLEKITGMIKSPAYELDFRRGLTECDYMGFAMTFNRALRTLFLLADENIITSHDWWAMLLAISHGTICFDNRVAAKHRRLENSISVMTMRNRISWLLETMKTGETGITSCAKAYCSVFSGENDNNYKYAKWFASDSYSPGLALKKAFFPGRWRPSLSSEVVLRILMLLGKV